MRWFSAMVVLTTTIEGLGPSSYWRSVFVFTAEDRESAKSRAIRLGRELEQSYRNGDGNLVEDRLQQVQTLDEIGEQISDGAEVWAEGVMVDDSPFDPFSEPASLEDEPGSAGVSIV